MRDLVTTGFWPVIAVRSPMAASIFLMSLTVSPTPMFTTIFSRRGTCMSLVYPNSFLRLGRILPW